MSQGLIKGFPKDVLSDTGDAIDVSVQSSTLPLGHYYLLNELQDDLTLAQDANVDSKDLTFNAGHGLTGVAGEMVVLWEGPYFLQTHTANVAGNVVSFRDPISYPFTTAATIIRGSNRLNVNGAVDPIDFVFKGLPSTAVPKLDLSEVRIRMTHSSAGTDSLFGNLTELAEVDAFYFRKVNGDRVPLGSMVNNGEFFDYGYTINYTDKVGGALFGTQISLNLIDVYTQEIRVDLLADILVASVNADLSALSSFTVSLLFSLTEGE